MVNKDEYNKCVFGKFRAKVTCLVAAKCRPVSVERNLKIEANVVVPDTLPCCSHCSLITFYVIMFYILFPGAGCFNTQNTARPGLWQANRFDIVRLTTPARFTQSY